MTTDNDNRHNAAVVGIGEALWDMLPEGRKIGGAPANFAYHVSQFGLHGCVASAVGPDCLGAELLERFTEKALTQYIPVVDYPTGTVEVTLDDNGIPSYDIREHVAWDNIPWTDSLEALASRTRAVCFGSLAQRDEVSRHTIRRFLDTMPADDGALRVFDINLRQEFYTADVVADSLARCNVLKINDEELVLISRLLGLPGIDMQQKCRMLLQRHELRMLILTCGINGSYVFAADGGVSFVDTPRVTVADTVGAGDSFTAAFIAATLHGLPVRQAHRLAVETSAYVCTCHGAMPALPADITSRVRPR